MEHSSSWEPTRSSAIQEIPRILWNPKVHYHSHNSPPTVPGERCITQANDIGVIGQYVLTVLRNIQHWKC
jgi:hypothetical protein